MKLGHPGDLELGRLAGEWRGDEEVELEAMRPDLG